MCVGPLVCGAVLLLSGPTQARSIARVGAALYTRCSISASAHTVCICANTCSAMCSLATPFAAPAPSCVYVHRPSALLRQPCPAAAAKQHEFRPFICQSGIRGRRSRGIIAPCRAQKGEINLSLLQRLARTLAFRQQSRMNRTLSIASVEVLNCS